MNGGAVEYVGLASRVMIAGVFVVAMAKARSWKSILSFVDSVRAFRMIPPTLIWPIAVVVVLCEAAVVLMLAVPGFGVAGFVLATSMLAVFTVAALLTILKGWQVPCRCFGISATPVGPVHIWRNAILLAVALIGATAPLDGQYRAPGVVASLVAAAGGTVLTLFLADFVSLFSAD